MKRVSFLVFCSIAFFALSCFVDLVLLTVDGDQAEPVFIEILGKSDVSTGLEGYRISPSGKETLLNQKFFDKGGNINIRSEVSNIYFTDVGLLFNDTSVVDRISNVKLHIGKNTYVYSSRDLLQELKGGSSSGRYSLSRKINSSFSLLPPFKRVINWSGDGKLGKEIVKDNIPILIILLLACSLYAQKSNVIIEWLTEKAASKNKMSAVITVMAILYRMPYQLYCLGEGVDMSWIIGLNWAQNRNVNWGTDIIFTYGPYYWLLVPDVILKQSWLYTSLVFTILFYGVSVYIVIQEIINQLKERALDTPMCVLLVLIIIFLNYSLADIVLASSLVLLYNANRNKFNILLVSVMLGCLSLTKFSYFIVSVAVILMYAIFALLNKGVKGLIMLITSFLITILVLWISANQQIVNLPTYIKNSFEITNGYTEAMSTALWKSDSPALTNYMNVGFLAYAIVVAGIIGILLLVKTKEPKPYICTLAMGYPLLFLAFKEGFVRFDKGHFTQFFEQLTILTIVYILFVRKYVDRKNLIYSLLAILLVMNVTMVGVKLPGYDKRMLAVVSGSNRDRILSLSKKQLRDSYPLSNELKSKLKGLEVDVFPWDIGMLYAYDIKWKPRPIFQSYSVYTSSLSATNADYIASKESPQRIVYTVKTIDDRNPMFDEPKVLPKLIENYDLNGRNDETYLLFEKRLVKRKISYDQISIHETVNLNQNVNVPVQRNHLEPIMVGMNVELTILGKALNFFYKVPPLKIIMKDKHDRTVATSRIIRRTATDGLLVSEYINSVEDFKRLFEKKFENKVDHFMIVGNNLMYTNDVKVSFYSLSF
jgi:hypothetical protein